MEPLKNMYNPAFLGKVAGIAQATIKGFDAGAFTKQIFAQNWEDLELKQRVRRISTVLHTHLTGNYKNDLKQVLKLTAALHAHAGRDNTFEYMFLPDYIEQYGIGHFEESFAAMEKVTVLCSCEYAIRPYIIARKEAALNIMSGWCGHHHPSVRRLASEGCRPRLPWAMALPELKKDAMPILPILGKLKDDPSEFVRKSVANNLNDIAKDNPDIVLSTAKDWKGVSKNTDWIIKHGCRTLLKKGDKTALKLFGLKGETACTVSGLKVDKKKIKIGDYLHFSFSITNEEARSAKLRLEYLITYAKANNKTSRKIFKITENEYAPGNTVSFSKRQSFADMTTRKHYTGRHRIAIVVNGIEKAHADFDVTQ